MSPQCISTCLERHAVCVVEGEIDVASADEFQLRALDSMNGHGPTLTLDLSRVTFMDCAGLSVLVYLRTEATARGGHVTLTGLSETISRLLRLSRLDVSFGLQGSAV